VAQVIPEVEECYEEAIPEPVAQVIPEVEECYVEPIPEPVAQVIPEEECEEAIVEVVH